MIDTWDIFLFDVLISIQSIMNAGKNGQEGIMPLIKTISKENRTLL